MSSAQRPRRWVIEERSPRLVPDEGGMVPDGQGGLRAWQPARCLGCQERFDAEEIWSLVRLCDSCYEKFLNDELEEYDG